jgi:hypothetical protein
MRRSLLLLLLALFVPVPAGAQEAAAPLLEDPEGDVALTVQGQAGPDNDLYPGADLRSLSLIESAASFTFVLGVGDLRPAAEDTGAEGTEWTISFAHNGRQFQVLAPRTLPALTSSDWVSVLSRDTADGEWTYIWREPGAMVLDFAQDTATITIPRDVFVDAAGAVPFPGRTLDDLRVLGKSGFSDGTINAGPGIMTEFPHEVIDHMPEPDGPGATYTISFGALQTGHARLWSSTPFRASNGEATTYVFQVTALNIGSSEDVFDLEATNVPRTLEVVVPVPLVALGGNESAELPILVRVPFGHDHGAAASFVLELRSRDDASSVGRLEMGVRFLAVAQPAGHHDTLFLHHPPEMGALDGLIAGAAYMNTLEEDPGEVDRPLHTVGLSSRSGDDFSYFWEYQLGPALEMGLDLDLERLGHIAIPIETTLPSMQATLHAGLWLVDGSFEEAPILVASTIPGTPVDLAPQGTHVFESDLIPAEEADALAFLPGRNLVLEVEATTATPAPTLNVAKEGLAISPGGWLQLPLNEWHDAVDDALAAVDGPVLTAVGSQERLLNAGEAVVFTVQVENPTNRSLALRLSVAGTNEAWATVTDPAFSVPADGSVNFTVVVRAPAEALNGDRADLVLQAYPRDDPASRGLLRLVAQVDGSQDFEDEAPLAAKLEKKDTPAPGLALATLALVALVAMRRRRA